MNCLRCGVTNENNMSFCYNCGARLEPAAAPTIVVTPQQQQMPPSYSPPAYTPPPVYPVQQTAYIPTSVANSSMSIISLIFGILAWVFLPAIGAIVAVVTGHIARKEIRDAAGRLGGDGLAVAGMIMGYTQLVLGMLAGCVFFAMIVLFGVAS